MVDFSAHGALAPMCSTTLSISLSVLLFDVIAIDSDALETILACEDGSDTDFDLLYHDLLST